jgi:hypothetical protein
MLSFIRDFLAHYPYPPEAVDAYLATAERVVDNADFQDLMTAYIQGERTLTDSIPLLASLADSLGINAYTLNAVYAIALSRHYLPDYIEQGYGDAMFYANMEDLLCKTYECIKSKGVPGTFVLGWYGMFYKLRLFTLGRFQYEPLPLEMDATLPDGRVLKAGTPVYSIHIPSTGVPLTEDVCLESYKLAHAFFKPEDGILIVHCRSWLLNPDHDIFLPEHSNIRRFSQSFEHYHFVSTGSFDDRYHVFGNTDDLEMADWPEQTSLQRAYKAWLMQGNLMKYGRGVLFFDGEKILE